jgi:two-component system, NarL family, nitrate/nitrite response regulator NarL
VSRRFMLSPADRDRSERPLATNRPHPRVLIADEDLPKRIGVRLALEEDGFVISAEEDTSEGAVAAALRDAPDLCLLDMHVPGGGIEAAAAIHSRLPQTHVVVLTAAANDEHLFAALEAGASGYLLKTNTAGLGAALRGVLHGEAALPRVLTARLIREFRARARRSETALIRRGKNELTEREWEVLDCLAERLSTRRIADRLFISQTTVRRHVGSILAKLEVPDRAAAVELAAKRSENLNAR